MPLSVKGGIFFRERPLSVEMPMALEMPVSVEMPLSKKKSPLPPPAGPVSRDVPWYREMLSNL